MTVLALAAAAAPVAADASTTTLHFHSVNDPRVAHLSEVAPPHRPMAAGQREGGPSFVASGTLPRDVEVALDGGIALVLEGRAASAPGAYATRVVVRLGDGPGAPVLADRTFHARAYDGGGGEDVGLHLPVAGPAGIACGFPDLGPACEGLSGDPGAGDVRPCRAPTDPVVEIACLLVAIAGAVAPDPVADRVAEQCERGDVALLSTVRDQCNGDYG
ncbi:MAG TPA: hypothetical protein VHH36_06985, partial [Candidatus Thermoplasmatota archaeon]|nr:hypothetical protein [Candidatus Thermoplasmatota archaeon]